MVQNLSLSLSNFNQSTMSLNSLSGSNASPTYFSTYYDGNVFQDIPLSALSKSSIKKLSNLLNSRKILRSEEGYERDWRGLAFLAKQKSMCDETIARSDDPMARVIQLWCNNNPNTATFEYLEKYLGVIDRWDVCDDIFENLVEDIKIYQSKNRQSVCSTDITDSPADILPEVGLESDPNILTTDDVKRAEKGMPPQKYDAFVLYADADLNYVSEMLTKLEDSTEYNFKLCIKDRDLLGGVASKYGALTQLIEERCKYLIVILTNAFLKSAENKFLVDFTQAIQIERKTRKIIPLLYEENIEIPRTLHIYTHLRYNNKLLSFCDFWSKLANSIRNVNLVIEPASPSIVRSDMLNMNVAKTSLTSNVRAQTLKSSPAVSKNTVPNINIDAYASGDNLEYYQREDRPKLRAYTMRSNRNDKNLCESPVLRNALSTGQLNTSPLNKTTVAVSTTFESKKKKKWPKLLKVFTRSSTKLNQQTA